jgi:ribosomal protein S17E
MEPKKSDWKRFRNSLEKWRESYIKRKNREIRDILKKNNLTETEKFWDIADFQKKESKKLRNCLDGYTKSNMTLRMALMQKYEMICNEDLEEFSKEMQELMKNYNGI